MTERIVAVPLTATPDPAGAGVTALAGAALRRPRSWPEWLGASAPAAAAGLAVWPALADRLGRTPTCLIRAHFGVPCPLCGGTRAGRALLDLDVTTALVANPLAVVLAASGALMLVVWVLRQAGVLAGPRRWSTATSRRAGFGFAAALALSWAYQWAYQLRF